MLYIFTIVLDAMPWIEKHLPVFQSLDIDWRWIIVEGTAAPTKDTSWVKGIMPRLSVDGTTEYINSIRDKRVKVIRARRWENKTSMCNAALAEMRESGVLLQVDADEVWTKKAIQETCDMFASNPEYGAARFWCRYFLGKGIMATSIDGYGNRADEWIRAWRFKRGMKFLKHEPPTLSGCNEIASRGFTLYLGLTFDHYSWVDPEQVKRKCEYYGHPYSYEAWLLLQNNNVWPVTDLQKILPWVGPNATANKI